MKRLAVILLLLMLCASCALAEGDNRAALWRDAPLLSAPLEGAKEVMRYYAGTRVEVVREVDSYYVYVNVGTQGGSQMGYMKKNMLVFGEEKIRKVYPERKRYPQHGWTLYSYCDLLSSVITENNDVNLYAIGENEEWAHVQMTSGIKQWTGFVNKAEAGISDDMGERDSLGWIYTQPLEGEMTYEDAIEYAKNVILKEGTTANGQSNVLVTREMLDGCRTEVGVQWDLDEYYSGAYSEKQIRELGIKNLETTMPLSYEVTFYYTDRTWEDGFPMICALAVLYVDGNEVVSYHFGRG